MPPTPTSPPIGIIRVSRGIWTSRLAKFIADSVRVEGMA